MSRKRVYICGPISKGDLLANVRQADEAFAALLRTGFAPLCPHWSVYHGSARRHWMHTWDPATDEYKKTREVVTATAHPQPAGTTHEDWMGVDLPWVEVSDAVLRLPGESVGADAEVDHAISKGVLVFHTVEAVVNYFKPAG